MAVIREEIKIASTADTRGFKKAETAAAKLNKSLKVLGVSLSAVAVADFGKTSLKAFLDDEKAATKLALAVKNLGMEFANPYVADYINNLEQTAKIADDELRPAFQALLSTTGSLAKTQSILNTAIEVSRGSGEDLATVSNDLAQAYVGNTKGLKKYYLGLDAAALKAASFTDIQKIMNDQFTGSSVAYLSTYSGQVGVLSLAWGNFQEKVGGTLLTLASFGDGENGGRLNLLAVTLEKIGTAIELIGKGKEAIAGLFNITGKNGLLSKFNPYAVATPEKPDQKPENVLDKYKKLLAQIEKDRAKQNAALIASNKKLTAEQKKQAALKKAGTVFDLEQIQLIAALKGKLSAEERLRVEAQLALLNENDVLAQQLTKQILDAQDATGGLYRYFLTIGDTKIKNPFAFLDDWIKQFQDKLNGLKVPTINPNGTLSNVSIGSQGGIGTTTISPSISSDAAIQGTFNKVLLDQLASGAGLDQAATLALSSARYEAAAQQYAQPVINVTVQGNLIREQELIDKVLAGAQLSSLSGSPSQIGRISGMFG